MKYPKISIIFPNLNGGKMLVRTIRSFLNVTYPKLEIIVVDNGSTDRPTEELKKLRTKELINLSIISNKKNLGFAKAINQGTKIAKGEYLFITNNDVTVTRNFFSELVSFSLDQNVDIAGPDGFKYNLYTGLFRKAKSDEDPDWIPGYALFVKRFVWKRLGGFDEGFFFTFEDLDFCMRAKKLGLKIQACPGLKISHSDGTTVNRKENLEFKYYQGYKSKIRFILKHGTLIQKLTNFTFQFLVFAPYRVLILQEKSFIPLLKATLWNINEKK